jgi:hypothetical protein
MIQMLRRSVVIGVAVTVATSACSTARDVPDAPSEAGAVDAVQRGDGLANSDAPGVAPDGLPSGPCNSLVNQGSAIKPTDVPQAMPMAQGGTPSLGTYLLTAYNVYTGIGGHAGPTAQALSETWEMTSFTGDVLSIADVTASPGGADAHQNLQIKLAGSAGTLFYTCPSPSMGAVTYTATAREFRLFFGDQVREFVYSKQ